MNNLLIKNDFLETGKEIDKTLKCNKCKTCEIIKENETIRNDKKYINIKIKTTSSYKTEYLMYVARRKKHKLLYIGKTGDTLSNRFSKHKYDILKRPYNNELADHFNIDHNLEENLDVLFVENNFVSSQSYRGR